MFFSHAYSDGCMDETDRQVVAVHIAQKKLLREDTATSRLI